MNIVLEDFSLVNNGRENLCLLVFRHLCMTTVYIFLVLFLGCIVKSALITISWHRSSITGGDFFKNGSNIYSPLVQYYCLLRCCPESVKIIFNKAFQPKFSSSRSESFLGSAFPQTSFSIDSFRTQLKKLITLVKNGDKKHQM